MHWQLAWHQVFRWLPCVFSWGTHPFFPSFVKDDLSYHQNSSIVYKCKYQYNYEYVGRTNQQLNTRNDQHLLPSIRQGSSNFSLLDTQSVHDSAFGQNLMDNCAATYVNDSFTVLTRARNAGLLRLLEAVYIKLHQPPLCKQKELFICSLCLLGWVTIFTCNHFSLYSNISPLFSSFFFTNKF